NGSMTVTAEDKTYSVSNFKENLLATTDFATQAKAFAQAEVLQDAKPPKSLLKLQGVTSSLGIALDERPASERKAAFKVFRGPNPGGGTSWVMQVQWDEGGRVIAHILSDWEQDHAGENAYLLTPRS